MGRTGGTRETEDRTVKAQAGEAAEGWRGGSTGGRSGGKIDVEVSRGWDFKKGNQERLRSLLGLRGLGTQLLQTRDGKGTRRGWDGGSKGTHGGGSRAQGES